MGISSKHPSYLLALPDWEQMRQTHAGERRVKEAGVRYLPATSGMVLDGFSPMAAPNSPGAMAYVAYRARATFPEFVREAVQAMVGIIHARPATIMLPAALEPMRERATLANESLEMLMRRITEEQLISGRAGLLLDVPTLDPIQARDALPYIALYVAESIINWDPGTRDIPKPEALNLVVLNETEPQRNADFSWEIKEKHRVLILGDILENEEADGTATYMVGVFDDDDAVIDQSLLTTPTFKGNKLTRLPFVFVNTKDIASDVDMPPLLGLSNLALTIYRGEADYRQALFMQGQDTLVVIGGSPEDETYRTGAGATLKPPIGGDAKYIGVDSNGLPEMRSALENDYERARAKAGELLNESSRDRESGEALRVRIAARTTTLHSIATTCAFALQELLRIAATWVGADPNEVIVTPNTEFVQQTMTGKELLDLTSAKSAGAPLSYESLHNFMRARGMTTKTFEEELDAIEEEADLMLAAPPSTDEFGPAPDQEQVEGEGEEEDEADDEEEDET